MPITYDDKDARAKLDQLLPKILAGAEQGLATIAPVIEHAMQTDPAHGDQSGAAHASYFAAPLGGSQNGQSVADAAYNAAAALLSGFTGHGGNPAHIDVPTVGALQRGLLFGSPVDYAQKLAAEGRSPVAPLLNQFAGAIGQAAAQGIKEALK